MGLCLYMYVADSMFVVNRTSSMPKSVLRYELDKDSTLNCKLPLNSAVHQIKKTDGQWELNILDPIDPRNWIAFCEWLN